MTAIAATSARTPIAIQVFRLTVIGFLLSFKRVVHKDYEALPIRDWPESGVAVPRATAQATGSQGAALRQRVGHPGGLWRLAEAAALDEKRLFSKMATLQESGQYATIPPS
jgi:hypothetical protein